MTQWTPAPLPRPENAKGATRRIGVEIEFAGLDLDETAHTVVDVLGGAPERNGAQTQVIRDSALGDITVELDTTLKRFGDNTAVDNLLDAARQVIPVEIVTEPLTPSELVPLDALRAALSRAGARGSRDGVLFGFGVHLNVEITGTNDPHFADTVQAYALLEHALRAEMSLDTTRRLLPFVQPWPPGFVTDLLAQAHPTVDDLLPLYARHIQSRNHGLDLLPILKWADPDGYAQHFVNVSSGARPAFHFRLPESRIDEDTWSLAQSWSQWRRVETVAADADMRAALATSWAERAVADHAVYAQTLLRDDAEAALHG